MIVNHTKDKLGIVSYAKKEYRYLPFFQRLQSLDSMLRWTSEVAVAKI